jgi:hypothetical protein
MAACGHGVYGKGNPHKVPVCGTQRASFRACSTDRAGRALRCRAEVRAHCSSVRLMPKGSADRGACFQFLGPILVPLDHPNWFPVRFVAEKQARLAFNKRLAEIKAG